MIDERINNNTGIENEEQEIDLVALYSNTFFIGVGLWLVY